MFSDYNQEILSIQDTNIIYNRSALLISLFCSILNGLICKNMINLNYFLFLIFPNVTQIIIILANIDINQQLIPKFSYCTSMAILFTIGLVIPINKNGPLILFIILASSIYSFICCIDIYRIKPLVKVVTSASIFFLGILGFTILILEDYSTGNCIVYTIYIWYILFKFRAIIFDI